jgi:hypothetical protein
VAPLARDVSEDQFVGLPLAVALVRDGWQPRMEHRRNTGKKRPFLSAGLFLPIQSVFNLCFIRGYITLFYISGYELMGRV